MRNNIAKTKRIIISVLFVLCMITMTACSPGETAAKVTGSLNESPGQNAGALQQVVSTLGQDSVSPPLEEIEAALPEYDGTPYAWLNEDRPYFDKGAGADDVFNSKALDKSFEYYAPLDSIGRCGTCVACIGEDIMPTEKRGSIGMIKPTGWHTVRYDNVEGKYLYNRCHLIGYQLTGENANRSNLITGTRYMNVQGMLPREELVADYVKRTGNHVLYRVTPVFLDDNLVASGVIMEAKSVEDDGDGLQFNVYVYNEQPGTVINHSTGDSKSLLNDELGTATSNGSYDSREPNKDDSNSSGVSSDDEAVDYIANTNTDKFHYPWCSSVRQMSDRNKYTYRGSRQGLIDQGYDPCGNCNP